MKGVYQSIRLAHVSIRMLSQMKDMLRTPSIGKPSDCQPRCVQRNLLDRVNTLDNSACHDKISYITSA